jgi:hypothetical protein
LNKNKNITDLNRVINEFKKELPTYNLEKDENDDLLADFHSINDVRQTEMHTAEPLVPESSSFKGKIAIEKLKSYKSPGTDQILAEMIQVKSKTLHSYIC